MNFVHVSVKDTGIGIDPQHLASIFDRSYKVEHSGAPRFGGLGISIALARDIVQAHGGKMWAESELKNGSIFHFLLPSSG